MQTTLKAEIRKNIYTLGQQIPRLSDRDIAKRLSISRDSVLKYRNVQPNGKVIGPLPVEKSEVNDKGWAIDIRNTRIHTLAELVKHFAIDLSVWSVASFICNKWEVGAKNAAGDLVVEPLYQVKASLQRKVDVVAVQNEIESLKEIAKSNSKKIARVVHGSTPNDLMLEINFPDSHLGKLAWGIETGHANYDVKIAEVVYWEALEAILSRVSHHKFSSILYVVGNDVLNSDDIEGRTTAGTYVSSDARYHKTFAAVRNLQIKSVERLRQIAPVKVVIVPGNHDKLGCWHLGDSLECYFHNYTDVEIDNLPTVRKYHQHGLVGLMLCHGHKGKRTDFPLLMATERSKMWGETKFREIHTGHNHMTKTDEQHGVRVRVLPALCAPDDWLAENGMVGNLRNAEGYVWSATEGLIEQVYYTVSE